MKDRCAFICLRRFGWLCLTSHRQRGHLETAPPFTVPCEGCEAWFLHCSHRELNPGLSRGRGTDGYILVTYKCLTKICPCCDTIHIIMSFKL